MDLEFLLGGQNVLKLDCDGLFIPSKYMKKILNCTLYLFMFKYLFIGCIGS